MKQQQTFLVRVSVSEPIAGLDLLRIILGQKRFPDTILALELGEYDSAPQLWEKVLREFAEKRGLTILKGQTA